MRDVGATRRLRERDKLVRRRERSRRVDQCRPEAERALRCGLTREAPHPLELARIRWTVVITDLVHAKSGGTDERGDVHRDAEPHKVIETLSQSRPRNVVPDIPLALDLIPSHRVGERTHRGSLAEDFERDALMHIARRAPVRDERRDRPREHVDEAGCDRETGCVDLAPPAISDRRHDRDDQITINRDVGGIRRSAFSIVDRAVTYDEVVHRAAILRRRVIGSPLPK